jgi:hypothetical protein
VPSPRVDTCVRAMQIPSAHGRFCTACAHLEGVNISSQAPSSPSHSVTSLPTGSGGDGGGGCSCCKNAAWKRPRAPTVHARTHAQVVSASQLLRARSRHTQGLAAMEPRWPSSCKAQPHDRLPRHRRRRPAKSHTQAAHCRGRVVEEIDQLPTERVTTLRRRWPRRRAVAAREVPTPHHAPALAPRQHIPAQGSTGRAAGPLPTVPARTTADRAERPQTRPASQPDRQQTRTSPCKHRTRQW